MSRVASHGGRTRQELTVEGATGGDGDIVISVDGMGEVYRARDTHAMGTEVCVI